MESERIIIRYAEMLSKQDVEYFLFSLLDNTKLSKLATKCNLTRRTLYKIKERSTLKFETKLKILKACLETSPEDVFSFLLDRYKEDTTGVLMFYLSHLYRKTLAQKNPQAFEKALNDFLTLREKNFGLISDEIEGEVDTMLQYLSNNAINLNLPLPSASLSTITPKRLMQTLPSIAHTIVYGTETPESISKLYNVPLMWVQSVASSTKSLSINPQKPINCIPFTAGTIVYPKGPIVWNDQTFTPIAATGDLNGIKYE